MTGSLSIISCGVPSRVVGRSHNNLTDNIGHRWGPQISQRKYENVQRLYLAEQTDGVLPNTLIIVNCYIMKPGVVAPEDISEFNEETQSPSVKKYKTLIHPGEVNRIRELPQRSNIVATNTDTDVFIWDLDTQPNRPYAIKPAENRPNAILTGHTENLNFALAMCSTEPYVLSGAQDKAVILWSIEDSITSLGLKESRRNSLRLSPRGVFAGHCATVQDVQFCPSSVQEFCSVGDDSCLMLWDARSGNAPVVRVKKAHEAEVYCVDWNKNDDKLILTGSADHNVHMFDRRKLTGGGVGSPIHKLENHKSLVLSIQWCPDRSSVFATAARDGMLNIWVHDQIGNNNENVGAQRMSAAPGLLFKHIGHRGSIMDFHWNPNDPWTIASVSTEMSPARGGGTLQIWRMRDLIYRSQEEQSQFEEHQETCGAPVKSKSGVVSQPVESKESKSPVATQPVDSKKSKSAVATQPVESKKSKSPVATQSVDSKKSKSTVATQPVESKKPNG